MRCQIAVVLAVSLATAMACAQDAPGNDDGPGGPPIAAAQAAPIERAPSAAQTAPQDVIPVPPAYDPAIFSRLVPPAELKPLLQADGAVVADVFHDRATRRLLMSAVPNDMFHYGRDISLPDTVSMELDQSPAAARVRDGRYVMLTGDDRAHQWMRHDARTLLWVDTKEGIVLGAFFFWPSNGEPGPTLTVFTRQIKQDEIHYSELPPAFVTDLTEWQQRSHLPPAPITYFIGDISRKFVLEHDLDFCSNEIIAGSFGDACEQMDADALDGDLMAALYLDQVNHATNATAYMLNDPNQASWVVYRNRTCVNGPDPLACRIRLTRTRLAIVTRGPVRR